MNDDFFLNPCNYCPFIIGEYCNFFNAFVHDGIDLNLISYDCVLPDFRFDGVKIIWS